jgi:hypothetical protein
MAAELLAKFAALKQETDFELTKDNRKWNSRDAPG